MPPGYVMSPLTGLWILAFLACLAPTATWGSIRFQESGPDAGLDYQGLSNGAAWGDFNGDGWPDLYTSNHNTQPSLYLNNGDGTFTDIILDVWSGIPEADTHGAAWADMDNDGDQDLLQLVGASRGVGTGPNQAFLNSGGLLVDLAATIGLDYPLGRGRTPLWFDGDLDGDLDVVICNRRRDDGLAGTTIFAQIDDSFLDVGPALGFAPEGSPHFALLTDLSGDRMMDLVIPGSPFPGMVLGYGPDGPIDLLPGLVGLPVANRTLIKDAVPGDFDGDLRLDLFLIGDRGGSDAMVTEPGKLEMSIKTGGDSKGFTFTGGVSFSIELFGHPYVSPDEIHIGADGWHPGSPSFLVSAKIPECWGLAPPDTAAAAAIYLGYLPEEKVWQFMVSGVQSQWVDGIITGSPDLQVVSTSGFLPFKAYSRDYLVLWTPEGFVTSVLPEPTAAGSVVSGDFDNDTDLDIYLVCTGPVRNLPNLLLENQGNGTFQTVPQGGGARGSDLGLGESVAVADYDRDGYLDLFVTNGADYLPFAEDGPHQLFRNVTGEQSSSPNHWIQIDLVGSLSNRDGIGASVLAHSAGVAQIRERNGGMHLYSQNHSRLHFGLGPATLVDSLIVHWPSGIIQTLYSLPVDSIYTIEEPLEKNGRITRGNQGETGAGTEIPLLVPGRVFPNPFNAHTSLEFEITRRVRVRIEVFDLAGRLVRSLADEVYPPGRHRVEWDGADQAGRPLASGAYYLGLSSGSSREIRKAVLCK
ncbi:MAG: FG-GAP-like repeat-containing protein [bacterium]